MKKIKYIDKALEVLEVNEKLKEESATIFNNGKIKDNKYKGYVASFGASVIQCGIKATVMIYSEKGKDKAKVMKLLMKIASDSFDLEKDETWVYYKNWKNENNEDEDEDKKREILVDAATALKLAMRTYEVEKENTQ